MNIAELESKLAKNQKRLKHIEHCDATVRDALQNKLSGLKQKLSEAGHTEQLEYDLLHQEQQVQLLYFESLSPYDQASIPKHELEKYHEYKAAPLTRSASKKQLEERNFFLSAIIHRTKIFKKLAPLLEIVDVQELKDETSPLLNIQLFGQRFIASDVSSVECRKELMLVECHVRLIYLNKLINTWQILLSRKQAADFKYFKTQFNELYTDKEKLVKCHTFVRNLTKLFLLDHSYQKSDLYFKPAKIGEDKSPFLKSILLRTKLADDKLEFTQPRIKEINEFKSEVPFGIKLISIKIKFRLGLFEIDEIKNLELEFYRLQCQKKLAHLASVIRAGSYEITPENLMQLESHQKSLMLKDKNELKACLSFCKLQETFEEMQIAPAKRKMFLSVHSKLKELISNHQQKIERFANYPELIMLVDSFLEDFNLSVTNKKRSEQINRTKQMLHYIDKLLFPATTAYGSYASTTRFSFGPGPLKLFDQKKVESTELKKLDISKPVLTR